MTVSTPRPMGACWRFGVSFPAKLAGFSLIETLIYLSLFSLLALAIMAFYGYFLTASITNRDRGTTGLDRAWVEAALKDDQTSISAEHCQLIPIPPPMTDNALPLAIITISPTSHEPEKDWLGFLSSGHGEVETSTSQGVRRQVITYDNLFFNGQPVWPLAAADFEPATGRLRICSSHGSGCSAALAVSPSAEQWRRAFSTITYLARSAPEHATKTFTFTLGFPVRDRFALTIHAPRYLAYCQQAVSLPPNFQ
jgi:hypothetical protein